MLLALILAATVIVVKPGVVVPATANLFAETFNPAGYDNAWADTSSGGTADPDNATNPPVGSGGANCSGFATQALKVTAGGFEQPQVWSDMGAAQSGEVDFRGYLYIESETVAVSASTAIAVFATATAPTMNGAATARIELAETAGDQLQLVFHVAFVPAGTFDVTTGTCYRVEFKWNDTADLTSARVDGTDVFVGAAANPGNTTEFMALGVEASDDAVIYWDTIGVGNTGYIGP